MLAFSFVEELPITFVGDVVFGRSCGGGSSFGSLLGARVGGRSVGIFGLAIVDTLLFGRGPVGCSVFTVSGGVFASGIGVVFGLYWRRGLRCLTFRSPLLLRGIGGGLLIVGGDPILAFSVGLSVSLSAGFGFRLGREALLWNSFGLGGITNGRRRLSSSIS